MEGPTEDAQVHSMQDIIDQQAENNVASGLDGDGGADVEPDEITAHNAEDAPQESNPMDTSVSGKDKADLEVCFKFINLILII